jgi:hypothetical protein
VASGQEIADGDSDISDEEIEEELGYISPLDSVDPYLAFKRSLSSMFLLSWQPSIATFRVN